MAGKQKKEQKPQNGFRGQPVKPQKKFRATPMKKGVY